MIGCRPIRKFLAAIVLTISLLEAAVSHACGPYFAQAIFVHELHPDFPLENFARGQLGVLQPAFARSYLFVAYRYLSGIGLDGAEQKAVMALWNHRLGLTNVETRDATIKDWLSERNSTLKLVPQAPPITVYRPGESYNWYPNCLEDGFRVATQTLRERRSIFGAKSQELREWISAQDQVFSNCSGGESIPSMVSSSAPPLLQYDRAYQIAAAHFYANHLDTAETLFRKIAADANSPWRSTAAYLVLRTLVRRASETSDAQARTARLQEADGEIQKVIADKQWLAIHRASARLTGYVQYRLNPQQRQLELAKRLVQKSQADSLQQDLSDYTWLLERQQPRAASDDLTDWILALEDNSDTAARRAFDKWRETKAHHWLIAAIVKVDGSSKETAEILKQVATLPANDPGYFTANYHRVRLLGELGITTEARDLLDSLLAKTQSKLPKSALNLFLRQRLALARNAEEIIKFAPRWPAAIATYTDIPLPGNEKSPYAAMKFFDADSADRLSRGLPIKVLLGAARSPGLPEHLRRDLVQAIWSRAVLLEDHQTAIEVAADLERLVPSLRSDLANYKQASNARNFTSVYLMLKNPGLQPYVSPGIGRRDQVNQIDAFRDNWWCNAKQIVTQTDALKRPWPYHTEPTTKNANLAETGKVNAPLFLSEPQKAALQSELARLAKLPPAPNYFAQRVLAWAQQNPNDPRVPEALHLTVRASRWACGDDSTGEFSKAAFDLLHKRYPQSPWTKKTPYWFS